MSLAWTRVDVGVCEERRLPEGLIARVSFKVWVRA